jgi:hypothetical protein
MATSSKHELAAALVIAAAAAAGWAFLLIELCAGLLYPVVA